VTRSPRLFVWLLLAAALFMRAVIPQGYMPERAESGAIAVALCNSNGVHLIPLGNRDGSPAKGQRAGEPCAFAGLTGPALAPPPLPRLPLRAPVKLAYADGAAFEVAPVAERFLPPVRGPPLSA
jgi:hypothetical protein